jgi:hypothetical protein
MSRSELQNGQPFPSVSSYTKPIVNPDGAIDILFALPTTHDQIKLDQDRVGYPIEDAAQRRACRPAATIQRRVD